MLEIVLWKKFGKKEKREMRQQAEEVLSQFPVEQVLPLKCF